MAIKVSISSFDYRTPKLVYICKVNVSCLMSIKGCIICNAKVEIKFMITKRLTSFGRKLQKRKRRQLAEFAKLKSVISILEEPQLEPHFPVY